MKSQFINETGLTDFNFLFTLNEGSTAQPAMPQDVAVYAQQVGITTFPVMANGAGVLEAAAPYFTGQARPELCALTPDMQILSCYTGHNQYIAAMNDIKAHVAAQ